MKYFVLLAGEESDGEAWDDLSPEQQGEVFAKHEAFGQACAEREGVDIVGGEALGDGSTATTMRTRNGELTVTDGPFAEAAEQIGGFYIVDAPDLDTLVELLGILPPHDIDIRPVLDVG